MTDHSRHFLSFADARAFARRLALPHRAAWRRWAKSHRVELHAEGVPSRPDVFYKPNDEWQGWTD